MLYFLNICIHTYIHSRLSNRFEIFNDFKISRITLKQLHFPIIFFSFFFFCTIQQFCFHRWFIIKENVHMLVHVYISQAVASICRLSRNYRRKVGKRKNHEIWVLGTRPYRNTKRNLFHGLYYLWIQKVSIRSQLTLPIILKTAFRCVVIATNTKRINGTKT